jgi:hypothetical protein
MAARVAQAHYLQVTDAHYQKAIDSAAQKAAQQMHAGHRSTPHNAPPIGAGATKNEGDRTYEGGERSRQESNTPSNSAGNPPISDGAAHNPAQLGGDSTPTPTPVPTLPPDLADLVSAWPTLAPAIRAGILAMVRAAA